MSNAPMLDVEWNVLSGMKHDKTIAQTFNIIHPTSNVTSMLDLGSMWIYSKVIEITWKHQETFQNIVLRMGTFLLAVLGFAIWLRRLTRHYYRI